MRTILALGATEALLKAPAWGAGHPIVSVYSSSEMGVETTSFCATQDKDGVLYIGTNYLSTFDGDRWTSTPIDGAYILRNLDFGPDGKLWAAIAGDLGWFEKRADFKWAFHSLRAALPPELAHSLGEVWYVLAEGRGAVFFSAERAMRWTGSEFVVWTMPDMRRLPAMRAGGRIFVHYPPQGLLEIGAAGPTEFIPAKTLKGMWVIGMEAHGTGWMLFTTKGAFLYDGKQLESFGPEVSEIVGRSDLTSVAKLLDGRYAFGTYKTGIVLMNPDGSLDRVLDESDGLPTHVINSIYTDREGGLWATSPSHVFRLQLNSPSTAFDERSGLPNQAYNEIAKVGNTVVLGTPDGLYTMSPTEKTFLHSAQVRQNIQDMRESGGGLIFGAMQALKRWDGSTVSTLYSTTADVFTVSTLRQSSEDFFISEGRNVVLWSPNAKARKVVRDLPDMARSIAQDDRGDLWLATASKGIFFAHIDGDSAVDGIAVPSSYALPQLKGRTYVRGAKDGAVVALAENGGWIKLAGQSQFKAIQNYYSGRVVAAISEIAPDGTAWVAYKPSTAIAAGVARIAIDRDGANWKPYEIDGLASIGPPRSILADRKNESETALWIGGTRSVLRSIVQEDAIAVPPKAPLVRALVRTKENALHSLVDSLPYSTRAIEFEFATPDFARRPSLRLESMVSGIDKDWTPAPADSRRALTALRDGSYTVQVRVVAETGLTSEPTVLKFEVLPPWWRAPRFLFCLALALIPAGYGVYWLRIRNLQRRNTELEVKVAARTEELVRANAAKTQFVANMSHDIRNPLNGILGLTLALEDSKLDAKQKEMVAILRECSTYLATLVDDVLDFASIEAGKIELRPEAFVPGEMLRSIVETLKADTANCGATLTVETSPALPPAVMGDAGRIQQILVNFVSNALKYAGGRIHITATLPPESPGEIEFAVRDEGPGISEEDQAKLFTKFTRVKRHHGSEDIPGTGLGLASCRLMADVMGGSVGLDSRPGEGARFHLRLPLIVVAEAPVAAPAAELPNATVLLVEDADYNAWAAAAVLKRLNLACERARTGAEALELFGTKRFNIVLLDRNLPDMDGTEVARRMREMEGAESRALLLAVTAYCTSEDRALCIEAGMDAFVGKPLTPVKLRKVLLAESQRMLAGTAVQAEEPAAAHGDLDLALLTYLSDGTDHGFDSQIERFVASLDEAEQQLMAAREARDYNDLALGAHRLLGQARMVGGAGLSGAASVLEAAARERESVACDTSLLRVRKEIESLRAAMRRRRRSALSA